MYSKDDEEYEEALGRANVLYLKDGNYSIVSKGTAGEKFDAKNYEATAEFTVAGDMNVTANVKLDSIIAGTLVVGDNNVTAFEKTVKYYKFVPDETDTYIFTSKADRGDPSCSIYSEAYYDDSIASNDDGGEGNNFRVSVSLIAGNSYYLRIYDSSASSDVQFTVNVEKMSDNYAKPDENYGGLRIYANNTYKYVSESGDTKYVVIPDESGYYIFASQNNTGDPYMSLYEENSVDYLYYNDDGGSGYNFERECYLEKGKTYYLYIGDNDGSGNTADITFERY